LINNHVMITVHRFRRKTLHTNAKESKILMKILVKYSTHNTWIL
jgi:hypothetical protein